MSRTRYYAIRTLQTAFMLWLVATAVFFLFRFMPGSYADVMTLGGASPEAIAAFKERWGLNDPLYVQYWRFLTNYLQLDAGTSIQYSVPVVEFVRRKIFNTFILVAPALTLSYILGIGFGTVAGFNRDSLLERYGTVPVIFVGSFPEFFLAIVLLVVFASWLNLFPTSGMISPETTNRFIGSEWWRMYLTGDFLSHYILPFSAVVLRYLFIPSLIMRTSVVETVGQDFSFYHRMTGLPKSKRLANIAKHSILPVITVYPATMTRALGGLVLIETVFNWPGIGFTLIQAVLARDFPVVQFVFLVVATFVILANFAVDVLYARIDPRVAVEG